MSQKTTLTVFLIILFAWSNSGCRPSNKGETATDEGDAAEKPASIVGTWSQVAPLTRGDTETERFTFNHDGTFRYTRFVIDGREYFPSMHGTWKDEAGVIQFTITETEAVDLMPTQSFDLRIVEQTSETLNFITLRLDDDVYDESKPGIPRTFLKRVQ